LGDVKELLLTHVINVALEELRLRTNTNFYLALATSRLASRNDAIAPGTGGYDSDEGLNDDEDPELLSLTGDARRCLIMPFIANSVVVLQPRTY